MNKYIPTLQDRMNDLAEEQYKKKRREAERLFLVDKLERERSQHLSDLLKTL
jgi:hypothetical protein